MRCDGGGRAEQGTREHRLPRRPPPLTARSRPPTPRRPLSARLESSIICKLQARAPRAGRRYQVDCARIDSFHGSLWRDAPGGKPPRSKWSDRYRNLANHVAGIPMHCLVLNFHFDCGKRTVVKARGLGWIYSERKRPRYRTTFAKMLVLF